MAEENFWHQLPKPIIGLSPMDDVTDHVYRNIQKKYGHPDLTYTEFTSVEGVCHGADRLLKDFLFDESQRPIVAQVYGTTPEFFRQTAIVLCELGFDGIDINMSCPAKNVAHSGAGAALIKTPRLAQEIIKATQQGIDDWVNGQSSQVCHDITAGILAEVTKRHAALPPEFQKRKKLPVSVKTRIGYDNPEVETWIPQVLAMNVAAIALHGRTLKQRYMGEADWAAIGRSVELCHQAQTLILGNGDIISLDDAHQKIDMYGLDGALIGRGSWGNPYVFRKVAGEKNLFEIAIEHAELYEKTYQNDEKYFFLPMRKHLGWYTKGIANASQIRIELFKSNSAQEVRDIFSKYHLLRQ